MENSKHIYYHETTTTDESTLYREFNQISLDQIETTTSSFQEEIVYRSVSVLSSHHDDTTLIGYNHSNSIPSTSATKSTQQQQHHDITTNKKSNLCSGLISTPSSSISLLTATSRNIFIAPALPDLLLLSHFEVKSDSDVVYTQIEKFLHDTNGLSYEFNSNLFQWTCVAVNGSSHSKFQISVYAKSPDSFIVEGNRLRGECMPYRSVYNQIKASFSHSLEEQRDLDSFSASVPMTGPLMNEDSCEREMAKSLDLIFGMAIQRNVEAQCEAARIICDLSLDSTLQQLLVDRGVLPILRDIICNSLCPGAQQHAISSLSNLSDAQIFPTHIIKEGLVPHLLKLAADGPYHTAELRRSAVHILANLCQGNSTDVANAIGQRDLCVWLNKVDEFKDDRVKVHAKRARDCLRDVVVF